MNNNEKTVILEKGVHFTPIGLMKWLNKNYSKRLQALGKKKTVFNINDIHQYILRNSLPEYINGQNRIEELYISEIDLKIIELEWI